MSKNKNNNNNNNNSKGMNKYILTPELGRLATAVNMLSPNGLDHNFADGSNLINASNVLSRQPGVAANVVCFIPGGISDNPSSAMNEASRGMFTWIRSKLMKNITRYEKTDLVIMSWAIANIHAAFKFFSNTLRIMKTYSPLNKYTPIATLQAMRIDTTDLTSYSIELEQYLSLLKHRLTQFVVPNIPFFGDVIEPFENVYADEDIVKAQYIVNVPSYFWKYILDPDTGLGKLVMVDYYHKEGFWTINDIKELFEDLLYELMNDEDYAFMSGDILAAYPNCYKFDTSALNTSPIEYKFDKFFLEKWHNSCQMGVSPINNERWKNWEITQKTSDTLDPYLYFNPILVSSTDAQFESDRRSCGNRYLDFYDRSVTPDRIMNATRWMYSFEIESESEKKLRFFTVGTQVVERVDIYYFNNLGVLQLVNYPGTFLLDEVDSTHFQAHIAYFRHSILLSKFNYAPMTIYIVQNTSVSGHSKGYYGVVGDLGNYTVLDRNVLKNINTLANYTVAGVTPLVQGR